MTEEKTSLTKLKPEEIESTIVELAKEGNTPAKIGLILRDKYGIPKAKLLGKKISTIVKQNGITPKDDITLINEKIEKLKKHSKVHKHDHTASRAITKHLWAIHGLQKH